MPELADSSAGRPSDPVLERMPLRPDRALLGQKPGKIGAGDAGAPSRVGGPGMQMVARLGRVIAGRVGPLRASRYRDLHH